MLYDQEPTEVVQDTRDTDSIFIHSSVDDAGLSPAEFRIYGHLARRAGANGAYPGVDSMAKICQLAKATIIKSIRRLEELGMIRVVRISGVKSRYVLTRRSVWLITTVTLNEQVPVQTRERGSSNEVTPPVQTRERKVIQEGNPSKDEAFTLSSAPAERRRPVGSVNGTKPSEEDIRRFCTTINLPESDGTAMFLHFEEKAWKGVKNWQITIRKWKSFGYLPSQKVKPATLQTKPKSDYYG